VFSDRRLPSGSLIFNVEANTMLLALKLVASSDESKFKICSDSLSCLLAIDSCKNPKPFHFVNI